MSKNIKILKNFLELDITKVFSNPNNPRKNIDDKELQELALSIKTHGLINPITVVEADNNQYMIVSGHRRYEALKINNDKTIIVNVIDVDSYQLNELVLIENIQRSDLTDFEKAKYISILWNTGIYEKKSHLATAIGKSPAYISHAFSCLKLEDSILTDLEENKTNVPLSVLEELSKVKDKDTQKNLYTKYLNNEITRDEIRILKPENLNINKENFARENKEIEENKINPISEENIVFIAQTYDEECLNIYNEHSLKASFHLVNNHDNIKFKENTKYKITIEEIKEVPKENTISKPFDTFEPIGIKHIEFCSDDVYIEYVDNDSETISYSKAKQILKHSTQKSIPYSLVDSEKSCNFINALSGFSQSNNCLVRKG
jgi:ParB family transcriptional regulator, chromosome partitioning protein